MISTCIYKYQFILNYSLHSQIISTPLWTWINISHQGTSIPERIVLKFEVTCFEQMILTQIQIKYLLLSK